MEPCTQPTPPGAPQLTLQNIHVPAETTLPWHCHAAPSAAYVVAGTLEVETPSGKRISVGPGQTLAEVANTVHRGRTGKQPVELLMFTAGNAGVPLSTPAPACQANTLHCLCE
ncbi:cupin domain-containing protein [Pseudomonas sp. NPDC089554]|uniref:cupin domain-containing protein n=1 Tax=Pseudomonas sp. NPDC089554 TaxID=3390653 RepID=UPI003CFBFC31